MKRRMMAAMLCALALFASAGCQLAREDAETTARADRLVGMLVTMERLDLFDIEGYLTDDFGRLTGGDIVIDEGAAAYQGRLYARRIENGATRPENEYVFDGVNGFPFFVVTVREQSGSEPNVTPSAHPAAPSNDTGDSYTTTVAGPELSDVKLAVNVSDTERRTTLTGSVYVSPDGGERSVYFNPVYQDAAGNVYAMSGDAGYLIDSWTEREGEVYAYTLDGAVTAPEDGAQMTDSVSVTLSVHRMFAPEKVVVIQMDARNVCLARTEYSPQSLPEEMALRADAAYLVVETHKRDETGQAQIKRAVYERDAESLDTFVPTTDGLYTKREMRLIWAD